MKLKVLASSSKGNCYLLQGQNEGLMLECGINYKEILKGLEFDLSNVIGCLVTHEHKDHSKATNDLIKNGIDVYTSKGTAEAANASGYRVHHIKSENQFKAGNFTIMPFTTQHDAAEPLGFLIQHKEMGKLLFATDTYYIKYNFSGLNHILLECNYSNDILKENIDQGIIPASLAARVIKSHFSLDNVKKFLNSTDLKEVNEVILMHLSHDNSDPELFKSEVERTTGKSVYIAKKGLEVDLSMF
jgi:phosphoribosyl 1,2-cyclic phosphodiesterase